MVTMTFYDKPEEALSTHDFITNYLAELVTALSMFAGDSKSHDIVAAMANAVELAMRSRGKLLIAGNGGSAADAQHIAGEFVSRLMYDRDPLPAIALSTDTSILTAIGNDYGYEYVFDRQVRALGRPGDVLLGISTSGQSRNILRALHSGRELGLTTIGFTGSASEGMQPLCDHLLATPSARTSIIQQLHIVAAHILCALVERAIYPRDRELSPRSKN